LTGGIKMKITIEIDSKSELDKLSTLFETFNINTIKVVSPDDSLTPIIKGDKKIDPKSLFGIWAGKPRSLENIRKAAWQRNQHIG
jgi:hypothetical protein